MFVCFFFYKHFFFFVFRKTKKENTKDKRFTQNSEYRRGEKRSDNPDVIYGRDFDDEVIPLSSVQTEMGEVCIRGQIMSLDSRAIRGEKTIIMFAITDFTDSIMIKLFA